MPPGAQRSQGRPDPVSCQSCRTKKLKCNRVQPCSNCSARGITCNFLVPPQRQTNASTTHSNAELLARIERLEAIILQQSSVETLVKQHTTDDNDATGRLAHASPRDVVSNVLQNRDQDSQLLESVGTREDSLLPRLSNGLVFRISSTREILEAQSSLHYPSPVTQYHLCNESVVIFPVYKVAVQLFQNYEANVDQMCRILHIPTTRSLIKTLYLRLNQGQSVLPGQAALMLSIFALSAFFYPFSDNSEVATTEQDSVHLSKSLSKGALDVLDYSRRNTSGTLEDIQAYIFMTFVTFHLDGFSARGRLLFSAAISIARDLRLNRLDADVDSPTINETGIQAFIGREVKRRVFWYLASSDWMQSTISGPQEGMYFINPNHVNVKLPKDCDDEEIFFGAGNEVIPGSQPTSMAYFLQRIRLSHLCREMVDLVPLEASKLDQMPYEDIISLDKKLVDFISNLPFFFRLDPESRERSKPLEAMYPHIPLLRYCITRAAHSRRCKLHQRFLLRQSSDPRYAYSRQACVESARGVLQFYKGLSADCPPFIVTARMGIAIHFMHLAVVVLVMDLCFNRDKADEAEIKTDVRTALQMFEDTKHISPLLQRFLSSLHDILQKHKVYLTDPLALTNSRIASFIDETNFNNLSPLPDGQMHFEQLSSNSQGLEATLDTSFDSFWEAAIQNEPNLDILAWDNLFSAIDTRPL